MSTSDEQDTQPAAHWHPPHGWGPAPEQGAEEQPPRPDGTASPSGAGTAPGAPPLGGWWAPFVRTSRRRAVVILAGVLALLGIYLCLITCYLATHLITRYEQKPPGTTVTSLETDYTLLELTSVPAPPSGSGGETDEPEENTAYAVAKIRVLVHPGSDRSYPCSNTELVDAEGRSWESIYTSSLPPSEDTDYCDGVVPGTPAVVTIAYAYPDSAVGRIAGVAIDPYSGAPTAVLVPPGS